MIILRDHKAFLTEHVERDEYLEEEIESVADRLQDSVEIGDNFNFRDFWKLVIQDQDLYERVFSSSLGHHPLQPFVDDANQKHEKSPDKAALTRVEVYRVVEIQDYSNLKYFKKMKKKDPTLVSREFRDYCGFHGIGPHTCDQTGEYTEEQSWAIEFTPISEYMDIPLKLDHSVRISQFGDSANAIDGGKCNFSMYEVIEAILNEISFCGFPEERDGRLGDLKDQIEDIRSGEAELHSGDLFEDEDENDEEE